MCFRETVIIHRLYPPRSPDLEWWGGGTEDETYVNNLHSLYEEKDNTQRKMANISRQVVHRVKQYFQKVPELLQSWTELYRQG